MLYIPYPFRRCPKCGNEYLPNTKHYSLDHKRRDGLCLYCKNCRNARGKAYHLENYERDKARARRYKEENREKVRAAGRQYAAEHKEDNRERNRLWAIENKQRAKERAKRWSEENHERYRENMRKWNSANRERQAQERRERMQDPEARKRAKESQRRSREKNPAHYLEYQRQSRIKNKTKYDEATRRWRAKHPEKVVAISQRRRARKRALPDTFTIADWQFALDYFGGCCAYCGRLPGLWRKLSQDHFIPVTKGGGYTPDNILPACNGMDGCNGSKNDRDALEWRTAKFGKRKAKQIAKRIAEYFAVVKSRHE